MATPRHGAVAQGLRASTLRLHRRRSKGLRFFGTGGSVSQEAGDLKNAIYKKNERAKVSWKE